MIQPHEFGYMHEAVLIYPGPGGVVILKKNFDYQYALQEENDEGDDEDGQATARYGRTLQASDRTAGAAAASGQAPGA